MSGDREIEAQLRDWAADVADQIPPWRPDQLAERRRSAGTRWRSAVALAAAAAMLVGLAGWWAADNDDQTLATGPPAGTDVAGVGGRTVEYERVEYWVTNVDLACPGAGLAGNEVSTAPIVFEAYADRAAKLWKNVVTYPNGDTRQVVAKGSAFYPTELYAGGVEPSAPVGCADPAIGVLAAEPGQSDFVSLNPLDEIPTWTDPSGEVAPMVQGYASVGVRQPEPAADDGGRACTIWRKNGSGFGGQGRAVRHQIDWCVEDATGKVLELIWTNGFDGIGVAVTRQTLTDTAPKTVPDDFFATDSLQRVAGAGYPNGAPSAGTESVTATTVAGGVAGTLPCPAGLNHVVYGRGSTNNGQPMIVAPSTPSDDPRQAVLDQWRGTYPPTRLDFEPAATPTGDTTLNGILNGELVAQFVLVHDGTGLVLDSVWTCGQKGPPPTPQTSGSIAAGPSGPATSTPTMPPRLECVAGIAQRAAPGSAAPAGGSAQPASGVEDPIAAAEGLLAGRPIAPSDAGPASYEIAEQTASRAVVHVRSGDRLVAVVWFRAEDGWVLDGMQSCYEG